MSDDQALNIIHTAAPKALDNRRHQTLIALDQFLALLPTIPSYETDDIKTWLEIRDHHWVPALQELHQGAQLIKDLFPNAEQTITALLETLHTLSTAHQHKLCALEFDHALQALAEDFYKLKLFTQDPDIARKLTQADTAIDTAWQAFHEQLRQFNPFAYSA